MSTDRYTRDVLLAHLEEMRKRVDSLALTFQDRGDAIRLATYDGRVASLRKLLRAVKLAKLARETIADMCGDLHEEIEKSADHMKCEADTSEPRNEQGQRIAIGSRVRGISGGGVGTVFSFHKRIVARVVTVDARITWGDGRNTLEAVRFLALAEE